jgi:hypothetical protein
MSASGKRQAASGKRQVNANKKDVAFDHQPKVIQT